MATVFFNNKYIPVSKLGLGDGADAYRLLQLEVPMTVEDVDAARAYLRAQKEYLLAQKFERLLSSYTYEWEEKVAAMEKKLAALHVVDGGKYVRNVEARLRYFDKLSKRLVEDALVRGKDVPLASLGLFDGANVRDLLQLDAPVTTLKGVDATREHLRAQEEYRLAQRLAELRSNEGSYKGDWESEAEFKEMTAGLEHKLARLKIADGTKYLEWVETRLQGLDMLYDHLVKKVQLDYGGMQVMSHGSNGTMADVILSQETGHDKTKRLDNAGVPLTYKEQEEYESALDELDRWRRMSTTHMNELHQAVNTRRRHIDVPRPSKPEWTLSKMAENAGLWIPGNLADLEAGLRRLGFIPGPLDEASIAEMARVPFKEIRAIAKMQNTPEYRLSFRFMGLKESDQIQEEDKAWGREQLRKMESELKNKYNIVDAEKFIAATHRLIEELKPRYEAAYEAAQVRLANREKAARRKQQRERKKLERALKKEKAAHHRQQREKKKLERALKKEKKAANHRQQSGKGGGYWERMRFARSQNMPYFDYGPNRYIRTTHGNLTHYKRLDRDN